MMMIKRRWNYFEKIYFASLFFFAPVAYSAETPDIENLGKAMKLNCKTFGNEVVRLALLP